MAARARRLTRENCSRDLVETDTPHQLAKAFELTRDHRPCAFRRQVASSRTGAAGRQHEIATFAIRQFDQGASDAIDPVGDDLDDGEPIRPDHPAEERFDGLPTEILVFAAAGAIGDDENPDPCDIFRIGPRACRHEQPPPPPQLQPDWTGPAASSCFSDHFIITVRQSVPGSSARSITFIRLSQSSLVARLAKRRTAPAAYSPTLSS